MSRPQGLGSGSGDREERRSGEGGEIPAIRSEVISPDLAQELQAVAGFTPQELFERRGAIVRRGLAALLENGDEVLQVHSDHVQIRRRDGSVQSFWNIERLPSWVRKVPPG